MFRRIVSRCQSSSLTPPRCFTVSPTTLTLGDTLNINLESSARLVKHPPRPHCGLASISISGFHLRGYLQSRQGRRCPVTCSRSSVGRSDGAGAGGWSSCYTRGGGDNKKCISKANSRLIAVHGFRVSQHDDHVMRRP